MLVMYAANLLETGWKAALKDPVIKGIKDDIVISIQNWQLTQRNKTANAERLKRFAEREFPNPLLFDFSEIDKNIAGGQLQSEKFSIVFNNCVMITLDEVPRGFRVMRWPSHIRGNEEFDLVPVDPEHPCHERLTFSQAQSTLLEWSDAWEKALERRPHPTQP